jgi:Tetratricopeptide repeat
MRSRFTISIIGWMLLTLLAPTSVKAQQETPYGTSRQPATCPSRSEPRTGRISSVQAIKYAICEVEGDQVVPQPGIANFLEIFSLQVSSPRPVSEADFVKYGKSINRSKPIYGIKGRAIFYACSRIAGTTQFAIGERGKNCQVWGSIDSNSINSVGECYIDFVDKWRCKLAYGGVKSIKGSPPNRANTIESSETQIDPNTNSKTYSQRARIKRNNKDYQGALADYNRAIQINPNDAPSYAERGVLKLIHLKDRPGAMKDLERAAKLYQQDGNTKGYQMVLKAIEESKKY